MGTARSCHGGEWRKRCKETPLFFTTTSQPSKLSPGMGFLLGSPVFYLLSLATDRGGGKNIDWKRQSKEIKQPVLLQQSTLQGWHREPTF